MDQRKDWHLTDLVAHEQGRGDPFAAAVRATRMPMVITNPRLPDNPIVFCNEAFQKLTGYERDEIIGRNCRFLQGPETDPATVRLVREAINAGTDVEVDLLNYRKDGTTFWNALYLSPVRDENGELSFFFASQLDVSDRVLAERRAVARREEVEHEVALRTADLAQALAGKTLLLHELDHRVKNNLMMVSSLLRLEARAADNEAVSAPLTAMLQRVEALGAVHRRLFQTGDLTRFDVGAFLRDLAAEVISAFGAGKIVLESDIHAVNVESGAASALGLVLNEMLTRAVVRGFAGHRGTLRVRARAEGAAARIEIADDGPNANRLASDGFDDRLVERLARQLRMQVSQDDLSPGVRVVLTLPIEHR